MSYNDQKPDQMSMENGDNWYFDEFGEYRNSADDVLTEASLQQEEMIPDEQAGTPETIHNGVSGDILADEDFNETLKSEYIDDQLNDPQLQNEAESDYQDNERSFGDKIKDKFNDLTGK